MPIVIGTRTRAEGDGGGKRLKSISLGLEEKNIYTHTEICKIKSDQR